MNAAIVLLQNEIEALQKRLPDALPGFGRERLLAAIGELCAALDFLRMHGHGSD